MQTNRNVDPIERLHNCQEERVPYAPLLLHSRIPGTTGTSIWIDRVAQRDISATICTDEENHCAFPLPALPTLPRHAHSHLNNVVKVHSRDTQPTFIPGKADGMYISTLPQQTIWRYETPEYEAESSLSSLSIIAKRSPVPLVRQTHSPLAQCIWAACTRPALAYRASAFKLLERLRWWLLIPGRLEFLFWLGGATLLMSSICIFLFVIPVSIDWMGGYGLTALPTARQSVVSCPNVYPTSLLMKLLLFMLHG